MNRPEILAPAGDPRALVAAVLAGADAVYFGLKGFNARGRAANFSPAQALQAVAFLRSRGVRSCLALNTVVREAELGELERLLRQLRRCPPDAVIFQDLAVLELVKRWLPGVALHASTQMGVHDRDGLRFLAELGVQRVVLARELALPEIKRLVQASPVELEVFVFGAMCASVSGACYASLLETGRSGNRGACAQVCRVARGGDFPFSMKDLDASADFEALAAAGVRAFKIEGRMKGADYVFETVRAFAALRDGGGQAASQAAARACLARVFRRETGSGYLHFPEGELLCPRKSGLQEEIGTVARCSGNRLTLNEGATVQPRPGDRLKVGGRGATVTGRRGATLSLAVSLNADPGQAVYLFPNQANVPGLEGLLRQLEGTPAPLPCRVEAVLEAGRIAVLAHWGAPGAAVEGNPAAAAGGGERFWAFSGEADTAPANQGGVTGEWLAQRLSSPACRVWHAAVNPNALVVRHAFLKQLRNELAQAAQRVDPADGPSLLGTYPAFSWEEPPDGALVLPPVEYGGGAAGQSVRAPSPSGARIPDAVPVMASVEPSPRGGEEAVKPPPQSPQDAPAVVVVNHFGQISRWRSVERRLYSGRFLPVANRVAAQILRQTGVDGFVEPHELRPGPDTPFFVLRRAPQQLPPGFRAERLPSGAVLVFGPKGLALPSLALAPSPSPSRPKPNGN